MHCRGRATRGCLGGASLSARSAPRFKIPKPSNVFVSATPLPRGGTGKILKRQIRDTVNAGLVAKRGGAAKL